MTHEKTSASGCGRQDVAAIVVAAGQGTRFGSERPKQYLSLAGIPLLRHSLARLARHPRISRVCAVIHPAHMIHYEVAAAGLALLPPQLGDATRQGSVLCGLERLAADPPAKVLIHDGARPLLRAGLVDSLLEALETSAGAIAALPVIDTLKRADPTGTRISQTVDRAQLWRAQTPQGFHFDAILDAHRQAKLRQSPAGMTDDAAVAEAAGLEVRLVPGDADNIKVTTPADLERAERLLGAADIRIGQGFDVHRFGPGDTVTLCGVSIPHDARLEGHSDADVALHALTDAILGALGSGDIGEHFPPSDPKWRGAPSSAFLRFAGEQVATRGGSIRHLDLTIICERPKIGPHREVMRAEVATLLGLAVDRISVKATTTERLGFTGRGEGIAAQAVATVALPGFVDP